MKKNILVIVLDQLSWRALKVFGGEADTPNIDRLVSTGVVADAAYCTFPLCQPSRASFWSGEYPHRNQVWSNGKAWPITENDATHPALGDTFSKAGYCCRHFGKLHDGGALRGFICDEEKQTRIADEYDCFPFNFDTYCDVYTADKASAFLRSYDGRRPLLMVADLINPHNICGWIGHNKGMHKDCKVPFPLPSLPPNYEFADISNRPLPVQYLCCTHIRQGQASKWNDENFRHYLAAYYYYLGVADRHVGHILEALEESCIAENTLIVLFSDHGDNMASRHSVTKDVTMYEEVTRVPLIFSGPGVTHREKPVKGLCSLLDIFPTLCSYAAIPSPCNLDGMDISSLLEKGELPWREYVVSQWFTEWGYTISPGRMIRNDRFKYIHYLEGNGEELYDLHEDPHEMRNIASIEYYKSELEKMRKLFRKYIEESSDPYLSLDYKVENRWRTHPVGYHNHEGLTAPEVMK